MGRLLLLWLALTCTGLPARADDAAARAAETIAQALETSDPSKALMDMFFDLDDRTGRHSLATFVRDPEVAARRREFVLNGNCEALSELESNTLLARFPQIDPTTEQPPVRHLFEFAVASLTEGLSICFRNQQIVKAMAGRQSLEHLGFPLLAGRLLRSDPARPRIAINNLTTTEVAGSLSYLWREAVCENNGDAIASLLRYAHAPRLIEFPAAEAHYLFQRARARGLNATAARNASPLYQSSELTADQRRRIESAASDDRPIHEREALLTWERDCPGKPTLRFLDPMAPENPWASEY